MAIKEFEIPTRNETDLARKIAFELLGLQAVPAYTMNLIREAIAEQAALTH